MCSPCIELDRECLLDTVEELGTPNLKATLSYCPNSASHFNIKIHLIHRKYNLNIPTGSPCHMFYCRTTNYNVESSTVKPVSRDTLLRGHPVIRGNVLIKSPHVKEHTMKGHLSCGDTCLEYCGAP